MKGPLCSSRPHPRRRAKACSGGEALAHPNPIDPLFPAKGPDPCAPQTTVVRPRLSAGTKLIPKSGAPTRNNPATGLDDARGRPPPTHNPEKTHKGPALAHMAFNASDSPGDKIPSGRALMYPNPLKISISHGSGARGDGVLQLRPAFTRFFCSGPPHVSKGDPSPGNKGCIFFFFQNHLKNFLYHL